RRRILSGRRGAARAGGAPLQGGPRVSGRRPLRRGRRDRRPRRGDQRDGRGHVRDRGPRPPDGRLRKRRRSRSALALPARAGTHGSGPLPQDGPNPVHPRRVIFGGRAPDAAWRTIAPAPSASPTGTRPQAVAPRAARTPPVPPLSSPCPPPPLLL